MIRGKVKNLQIGNVKCRIKAQTKQLFTAGGTLLILDEVGCLFPLRAGGGILMIS